LLLVGGIGIIHLRKGPGHIDGDSVHIVHIWVNMLLHSNIYLAEAVCVPALSDATFGFAKMM
jgi:hypothetical protein